MSVQRTRVMSIGRWAATSVGVLVVSVTASACGGDTLGVATTVVNVTPTNFATIPPVASTLPGTTTTLPVGAVGAEQSYEVQAGDSPLAVANKYSISLTALLAYNGWVDPAQFPYPGTKIRIPPQAVVQPDNSTTSDSTPSNSSSNTPASSGCGTRPAGTYEIQSGDNVWAIRRTFCVSLDSLLAANGWADSNSVTIYPGQIIQIPAANS